MNFLINNLIWDFNLVYKFDKVMIIVYNIGFYSEDFFCCKS